MYLHDMDMMGPPEFQDRADAGRRLGRELASRIDADVVLGLTRGGVPVAAEVARALEAQLDVIVVKKIGAPFSSELAIGAVCSDGTRVVDPNAVQQMGVPDAYVDKTSEARLQEASDAEEKYREGRAAIDISGMSVVVVDDGVATGATMEAAVKSARNRGAARVIAAVPVSSTSAGRRLDNAADEVFSLISPENFWAVGQFYRDFSQTSDEEVTRLLDESERMRSTVKRSG